jgi:hypothetical protein
VIPSKADEHTPGAEWVASLLTYRLVTLTCAHALGLLQLMTAISASVTNLVAVTSASPQVLANLYQNIAISATSRILNRPLTPPERTQHSFNFLSVDNLEHREPLGYETLSGKENMSQLGKLG